MSSIGDQKDEGKKDTPMVWGCLISIIFLIGYPVAAFLFFVAEDWNNREPITKGLVVRFFSIGLLVALFAAGIHKVEKEPAGEKLKFCLFLLALFVAVIVAAFVILYFWKDVSIVDFLSVLRMSRPV